ncbi:hypothetical protein BE21_35945 [Sorangium cellulosum]|uniref:Peptidase C45 n=1 Tax=Sorangium cellulosum TaxID=56 RepID=A0A150TNI5_SORCE|nr:hypothetical protein BE21_35945 [Sorangium cellulosum]
MQEEVPVADMLNGGQRSTFENAHVQAIGGWLFAHIEGEPYQRGFQHGYLLAERIEKVLRAFRFFTYQGTGKDMEFFMEAADRLYTPWLGEEYTAEIKGIAEGARDRGVQTSYREMLAWNANVELLGGWWPSSGGKVPPALRKDFSCNLVIATGSATTDGGIVLGHATWDTFANGVLFNVALDIQPAAGHRILMHTAPGMIHSGTDFFLSGSGIIGAETTIPGFTKYAPDKAPEFYRVRKAMQYATTIDGWVETMLHLNNGGYANTWVVGDINTGEIARLELGLQHHSLTRTQDGAFWGCNVPLDPRIINQETQGVDPTNIMQSAGRRVRWEQLLAEQRRAGGIDAVSARRMLADHRDVWKREDNPSSRSICGHFDREPLEFAPLSFGPYHPYGSNDAKVTTSAMAREMSFVGRHGRPCGLPFNVNEFLALHPQYEPQRDFLEDKPRDPPWVRFGAGGPTVIAP